MKQDKSTAAQKDKKAEETESDLGDTSGSGPDAGPTMSVTGAMPSGPEMAHWDTSQSHADATDAGSMPKTKSKPMPGEKNHASRNQV